MTALTAKAAWWVLKGWKGSPGSVRRAVLDPLEMTALTAKAGSPGSLRNDSFDGQSCLVGFEGLEGQSWIP